MKQPARGRAARSVANTQHFNMRLQLQQALLEPARSTPEIVAEGLRWAKAQPTAAQPQPADADRDEEFNKDWDRRAVVMAAALAARDYAGDDRSEIEQWGKILQDAAADNDRPIVATIIIYSAAPSPARIDRDRGNRHKQA